LTYIGVVFLNRLDHFVFTTVFKAISVGLLVAFTLSFVFIFGLDGPTTFDDSLADGLGAG
jgi:hypothetical protein